VSVLVDAVALAAGALLVSLIARSVRDGRARSAAPAGSASGDEGGEPPDPLAGFPCKLGDVVVRRGERDEAWLAGALLLREDRPVAVLFVAPEAREDRALFVRDGSMSWLTPFPDTIAPVSGEPPHAIEHRGTTFERRRRLPVHVERLGDGAPHVGDSAVLGEYSGLGVERLVVIVGTDAVRAWHGVALSEDDYDVLPGSQSTLE